MAVKKEKAVNTFHAKPKVKKPGVHSKKSSKNKSSKNYKKINVGQG